jgi:hypothetical protein
MYLPCPIISLSLLAFYLVFVGCVNFGVLVFVLCLCCWGGWSSVCCFGGLLCYLLCCVVLYCVCCVVLVCEGGGGEAHSLKELPAQFGVQIARTRA